ncbi:MAG: hypothetical protein DKT66_08300 [Candidatus Melainabacteria bacterium]|nr:MAG: hypothetical protein DKT66_08300 [Candidatus Melainabacteria bacterium]
MPCSAVKLTKYFLLNSIALIAWLVAMLLAELAAAFDDKPPKVLAAHMKRSGLDSCSSMMFWL